MQSAFISKQRAGVLACFRQYHEVPDTEESIRYKMPAYTVGKDHLYFAACKKHIGFYPVYGLPELEEEISVYKAKKTKDSLHFLHDKPLLHDLFDAE